MNKEFETLVDNYLKWKYTFNPVYASRLGLSSYDGEIGNFSKEAEEEAISKLYGFKFSGEKISSDDLNYDNKIDRLFLLRDIELSLIRMERIRSREKNPLLYMDEALDSIHTLMLKSYRPLEYTASMILKRMEKIPRLFKEGKENLSFCPPVFLEVTSETIDHAADFINTVTQSYGRISPSLEADFEKASKKVKEAIIDFKGFINTITPGEENSFAVGKETFSDLVKTGYMIDKTLEEILETGEKCFASISYKLTNLASELDPSQSWYEIYRLLKKENPGPSGVLKMYLDYMNDARQYLIDNDIVTIPEDVFLDVDETPAFVRPVIPVAAYLSPGPYDEVQRGVFWVTPLQEELSEKEKENLTGEHNIYTARVTAPHEAYPGHHLQLCLSNRQKSNLRKQSHSDIFVEGWGLYCEEMMKEVGYMKGVKLELAQQVDQLMRAARVIIDVRLHTMGMTIKEAKDFMTDIVLVSPSTARVEVNRYTMTPTQPLSYMIGQLEIMSLREEYKKLKGDSFTLKDFHDKILSFGSSPIKIIRQMLLEGEDGT
ncbi:MAG TPA: DUF885 domain-containing protein [Candidatus Eremiobacteraeota bacterium]|nr:DUF885 domain-containing protein [Candidatus Eremiobacteraeota bacterium]